MALKLNKEVTPRLVLEIGDDIVITGDENSSFQFALLRLVVALTSPGFNIPKRAFTKFPPPVFLLIKSLSCCLSHRFTNSPLLLLHL